MLSHIYTFMFFSTLLLTRVLVQHACSSCPSVKNLKSVLDEAIKAKEAMTVAECFEEAEKKMAINGECIHAMEKVCVDHFKTHGDSQQVEEAEAMIGSWERKLTSSSETQPPIARLALTFIAAMLIIIN